MVIRENYLKKIRGFYHVNDLIKIIYGLRRCGKSVILNQIIDEIKKSGVKDKNIMYINLELIDFNHLKNGEDLYYYVKEKLNKDENNYVFIDEVQQLNDFESGINSLRTCGNYSIFITGSNSRITFSELSTKLTGRYVSFKINPLSFKEAKELKPAMTNEELLNDIFKNGSLPQRFLFDEESLINNYINDVYNSILLKDVVERLNIKDITTFNKILQYIISTESKEFSSSNIINYLSNNNVSLSYETLYNYIEALCSTFIIDKVYRYDVEGKNILKTLNKYYLTDLGIKKIKESNNNLNYSINLENIVYNELINKGYVVNVGKTKKGKIDFVANKDNVTKYIQVAYNLTEDSTIKREFGAYDYISDNFEKYVISTEKTDLSQNGIIHVNIFDFLLNENF